ncbi:SGNH/GDSL hydrolase family protein [Arthrobacter sp. 35W]|uniref:SGNH/GDSL hydrolase family protein n=1 Tax=Arthrobacter sp. 35W TaxID=1132441 RepID=UPI00041F0BBA|nr:SGNH/GDSL hydrolase family protein [Arthrobacter sp. 35W]
MVRRYVALGDSFTEGVGDPHRHLPNGLRGWADRVAEGLARAEPGWEYANLAVRSKRLRHIVAEQLDQAIALKPTLITLYAGGNDIMDLGTRMPVLMDAYEQLVARLAATGAQLVLFTGYDVQVSALLKPLRRRNRFYNDGVRRIARRYGAIVVDYANLGEYADRRMWSADRLHMSKAGHKHLAAVVLAQLEVEHRFTPKDWGPRDPRGLAGWSAEQAGWLRDWVVPLFGRKIRGITLGDSLAPRWPEPVRVPPKGGLRKLARKQRRQIGTSGGRP